jgi:hypothetical protein
MFERFTERARQVVVLAQDEARALGHNYIGTEHILLGLLREEEGIAARVLESRKVSVEEVRAQVGRIVGHGDVQATGQIPFTPRAKKVLELSLREALTLGNNHIGPEHILLGIAPRGRGARSPDPARLRCLAPRRRGGCAGAARREDRASRVHRVVRRRRAGERPLGREAVVLSATDRWPVVRSRARFGMGSLRHRLRARSVRRLAHLGLSFRLGAR